MDLAFHSISIKHSQINPLTWMTPLFSLLIALFACHVGRSDLFPQLYSDGQQCSIYALEHLAVPQFIGCSLEMVAHSHLAAGGTGGGQVDTTSGVEESGRHVRSQVQFVRHHLSGRSPVQPVISALVHTSLRAPMHFLLLTAQAAWANLAYCYVTLNVYVHLN